MNMAAPLQTSLTMGRLRPESRGSGNAFLLLVANLTRAASTLVGGAMIEQTGYRVPYLLTAALYAAASVLLWLWFGDRPLRRRRAGR
jgi:predicted MFS family arabinose efflux permease